jgi:hypothetical protein
MSKTPDNLDEERILREMLAEAELQYIKNSKQVLIMDRYKLAIARYFEAGFPWTVIAMKFEARTKQKISATTLRNYFNRENPGAVRPSKKRLAAVDAAPNIFAPSKLNLESPEGLPALEAKVNQGMNS